MNIGVDGLIDPSGGPVRARLAICQAHMAEVRIQVRPGDFSVDGMDWP